MWIWLESLLLGARPVNPGPVPSPPTLDVIVILHGDGALARSKAENLLAQDAPPGRGRVLFCFDGNAPPGLDLPPGFHDRGWRVLETGVHGGKNRALNHAVAASSGELLLFTDPDARLPETALSQIAAYFADPAVGGVCGRRMITERDNPMDDAQADFARLDDWIRRLESRRGSLTAGEGKLCALRRELFEPLPDGVTDDSYNGFSVVRRGKRFIHAPEIPVFIPKPARNPAHEIQRRRRIVSSSLKGIHLCRTLLNPFRHGGFAVRLFLNKIMRRLLPVFLLLFFLASAAGLGETPLFLVLFAGQALFYLGAALPLLARLNLPRPLSRLTGIAFYFTVGNLGMFLGIIDFLRGRQRVTWTPEKGCAP